MSDRTIVEFCISKQQTTPFSLVVPDHRERVGDLLADALYAAKSEWHEPEFAVVTMINSLGEVVPDMSLALGSVRGRLDDVIVVDFIGQIVSDRSILKTQTFKKWLEKHQVPS